MKKTKHLLIGLIFGILVGWTLGFLRIPFLEKNHSFLLGFTSALASVSLLVILLAAWNGSFLPGFIGKKTEAPDTKSTRAKTLVWIMLLGVLVLAGVLGGLSIYSQQESFKIQIQNQDKKLQEMAALEAHRTNNYLEPLMRSILEDIGAELKQNSGRRLRDTTIARIAALSLVFKPYNYVEGDSLSNVASSPERGQLLQALVLLNIDSVSFARIKESAVFAGADLSGTMLKGSDLSGINLKNANLKDCDLSGAKLKGADLSAATLWGTNLNQANLSNADLTKADLNWAKLNEASLVGAKLNGANLSNAQLRKADMTAAIVQWAQADAAMFNEANMTSVSYLGSRLVKVNFSQANLRYADLRKTDLSGADLSGAQLGNALVDESWLEKLTQWQPFGLREMHDNYTLANDTFGLGGRPLFRLRQK